MIVVKLKTVYKKEAFGFEILMGDEELLKMCYNYIVL